MSLHFEGLPVGTYSTCSRLFLCRWWHTRTSDKANILVPVGWLHQSLLGDYTNILVKKIWEPTRFFSYVWIGVSYPKFCMIWASQQSCDDELNMKVLENTMRIPHISKGGGMIFKLDSYIFYCEHKWIHPCFECTTLNGRRSAKQLTSREENTNVW